MNEKLDIEAQEDAMLVQIGPFQILLKCHLFHSEKDALLLSVRITEEDIIPETAWITLKEVACKLSLEDADCRLVCPTAVLKELCHHGDFVTEPMFLSIPLEVVQEAPNYHGRKIMCPNTVDFKNWLYP